MIGKRLLLVLALIILSAVSGWMLDTFSPPAKKVEQPLRHDPDYYMDDFNAITMNVSGDPRYSLQAKRLNHYPDDDTTELNRPHLEIHQEDASLWKIDADRGWISSDGELILLLGGVHIHRSSSMDARTYSLNTEELRVRPDDEYAETDKHVTIKSGRDTTEAVGMRAYIKEGKLQFLSKAQGRYEPSKR